jgi:putative copper export protein
VSETLDLKPEAKAEKLSDMGENFKKGVFFIAMLLLLVTTFQLYFSIQGIIDTWFEYQYAMVFKAVYYLFVLLVSLYIIKLYVIRQIKSEN